MCRAFAIRPRVAGGGVERPVSQVDTACLVAPTFAARSSALNPARSRSSRNRSARNPRTPLGGTVPTLYRPFKTASSSSIHFDPKVLCVLSLRVNVAAMWSFVRSSAILNQLRGAPNLFYSPVARPKGIPRCLSLSAPLVARDIRTVRPQVPSDHSCREFHMFASLALTAPQLPSTAGSALSRRRSSALGHYGRGATAVEIDRHCRSHRVYGGEQE